MDSLVIVESPTKERTISKFLKKGYVVKSSYGHVRDLPQRKLGVELDANYEPAYVVLPRAKKLLPQLNKVAKKAKNIFLATDYDREGEAIAWHLAQVLKAPQDKLRRITFHEITPEAIKRALTEPRALDTNLVDAQVARRVLDRLVGYKLSPLLWKKVKRGLSAGRVQSVAVRLICQREDEIGRFKPQEYWTLAAQFATEKKETFWAQIHSFEGKKFDRLDIKNKAAVDKILAEVEKGPYSVKSVEAKQRKRQPPAPFTTASLQQEASHRLGFRAQRTMIIAQQLYEGIDLGKDGSVGLITYMRTDSTFVAKAAQNEAAQYIESKFEKKFLPPKPRVFKTKTKGAQEAHEAIRPTSVMREPEAIKSKLSPEQHKLYKLIWDRFVASQMADAIYDTVNSEISSSAHKYIFRANGRTLKFKGFLALDSKLVDSEKDEMLPKLTKGDPLEKTDLKSEQHFTEPPPRFNEASLVKMMETQGIGRPSTYAPIIQTIIGRGYVRLEERRFVPTELGKTVDKQLLDNFAEIVDVNFTAELEGLLDHIADGKAKWQSVVKNFWVPFAKKLEVADKEMKVMKPKAQETKEKCDKCGAVMVIRESRFGRFLACSTYPTCTYKMSLDKQGNIVRPEETGEKCETCGKAIVVRMGRRGKFLACSGYPECKFTKSLPKEDKPETPPQSGGNCDNCGKEMVLKRGRFGEFWACSGYPHCKTIKKIS